MQLKHAYSNYTPIKLQKEVYSAWSPSLRGVVETAKEIWCIHKILFICTFSYKYTYILLLIFLNYQSFWIFQSFSRRYKFINMINKIIHEVCRLSYNWVFLFYLQENGQLWLALVLVWEWLIQIVKKISIHYYINQRLQNITLVNENKHFLLLIEDNKFLPKNNKHYIINAIILQ